MKALQDQLVIYNSLKGQKEPFIPRTSGKVGMYVCGPTLYSEPHMGNMRTFINFDLIYRYLLHLGFDVKYVGNSTVYHVGGATLQETNPQKTFLNFRNSLLNVIKNVPKQWFLFVVFSRLVLDGVAGIKFLIELRPVHTWAIVRAHLSVYKNFYKFLQKRKRLQKKYNYNLHTSVVWQYFILKRKKFKDLR